MTREEQNNRWHQFHVFQAKMERKWRPKVRKALQEQIEQFLSYASVHGYPIALSMLDMAITADPIANVLKGIHRNAGVRWGYITYREVNRIKRMLTGDIQSALLDYMEEYFNSFILDKATFQITDFTRKWIRETMAQGLADGKSYDQIANSLVNDDMNKVRALRIVRTETVRASNAGAVKGAQMTGLLLNKIWISAKDNRTRRLPRDSADHLHLDTQKVEMDGMFAVQTKKHGIIQMSQPGDPTAPGECVVNCRCCLGFEAVRDQRGRVIRMAA